MPTLVASTVIFKSLRIVDRLSGSKRVPRGDFFVPMLPQINWRGFHFRLAAFSDLCDTPLPRHHSSIALSHTHKDAGTPHLFLARHGLSILESIIVPHAKTLYRSDWVEHEREVNVSRYLCEKPTRSGDNV